MPVGGWKSYLKFAAVSLVSFAAGMQVVHKIYRPLDEFEEKVKQRAAEIKRERQELLDSVNLEQEKNSE